MVEDLTCAAVRILHAGNAPSMIDHAISTALRERNPPASRPRAACPRRYARSRRHSIQ
jgi:hypothetical protein